MFTKTKKFTALALSCIVLAGATNVQVFAATYSKPGNVDGAATNATLTTNNTSATTTYARYGATISATARIFYLSNGLCYGTEAENTSSAGGVSATATKKISSGQVIGNEGQHLVQYKDYRWAPILQDGTIPSRYNLL